MPCVKKQAFLRPLVPNLEKVPLPECGEGAFVLVQELGSKDLLQLQGRQGREAEVSNLDFTFDLLFRTLVDEEGNRLFDSQEDVKESFGLSVKSLERLTNEVCRIAGLKTDEKN